MKEKTHEEERPAKGGAPRRRKLRTSRVPKLGRYLAEMARETYLPHVIALLVGLWLLSALGVFAAERGVPGGRIETYGQALYWGVAAFSTAGIADTPASGAGQLIGGIWIVVGSVVFFGTIVASITGYFLRPHQRPVRKIVETIEYNLEHLEELSVEELDLLKETTDALILHVERLKKRHAAEPTA